MVKESLNLRLPLSVMQSAAGFYLGTFDEDGPVSRESVEYWRTAQEAEQALKSSSGGDVTWTQRLTP